MPTVNFISALNEEGDQLLQIFTSENNRVHFEKPFAFERGANNARLGLKNFLVDIDGKIYKGKVSTD